ncbi:RagB/SusD family nutrient uptake outer membrane protein [Sphingobacterium composti Ten et al. 2007 non Yoo et al. 2007]|uniref:RagB/SusD family nutrient uptake outer membrane protein n=1 Tax=Sphingobacterium composti TaxID=363260 RepID=UPI00135BF4FC|nr:RagB/SusD family nutrient uptake outer membrane protein [Sphingobacterium composti Ten et al. 2007 non Yoo et al. 2007]
MKRLHIYIGIMLALLASSCGKEWLKVTPVDNMSGTNYWQTEEDVEMFVRGIYNRFRDATMDMSYFPATGDLRCAPVVINQGSLASGNNEYNWMREIRFNNLKAIFSQYTNWSRDWGYNNDFFGMNQISNWNRMYKVIGTANIAQYELAQIKDGVLTDARKAQYTAEAAFMRNLSYFFLVRTFGDVPYYTEAYHSAALGRTNMLVVLQNIHADMEAHYKNLPWTQTDATEIGNRAMRGSALALMMHINMWLAGFSEANKEQYYSKAAEWGKELMEQNEGSYALLPLESTKEIFKGRTKEGLFEITQNFNYGELFHLSAMYADNFLRYPYKSLISRVTESYLSYQPSFMQKMYPVGAVDQRTEVWFEKENLYATDGRFVVLKTANIFSEEGENNNPDDNQIVFRYADAILLRAEALAELGGAANEAQAITLVNMIRTRAKATLAAGLSGKELKDFIWWERVRELLGEGHYFYDLVRTKKVLDANYCNPIPIDNFYRGAWTWPIDKAALNNNPGMTLNTFWN